MSCFHVMLKNMVACFLRFSWFCYHTPPRSEPSLSFISIVSMLLIFDYIPRSFSSVGSLTQKGSSVRSVWRVHGAGLLQLLQSVFLQGPWYWREQNLSKCQLLSSKWPTLLSSEYLLATLRVSPLPCCFLLPPTQMLFVFCG